MRVCYNLWKMITIISSLKIAMSIKILSKKK